MARNVTLARKGGWREGIVGKRKGFARKGGCKKGGGFAREPINLVVPPMIVRMHCQIIKPKARLGECPPAIMQNPGVVQSIPIYIKTHSDSSYHC